MQKFEVITKAQFRKIRENQLQIRTLEKLRDTLLPKLMSGEVRVTVEDEGRVITPVDNAELTLEQRLALFAPARHGDETMATEPLGAENGSVGKTGHR